MLTYLRYAVTMATVYYNQKQKKKKKFYFHYTDFINKYQDK
jgi:hypothetical protein